MTESIALVEKELNETRALLNGASESERPAIEKEIIADLDGSLAPKSQVLERALQRFAVDACNANNWEIPLTQLTLHNAYPVEEEEEEEEETATKPSRLP